MRIYIVLLFVFVLFGCNCQKQSLNKKGSEKPKNKTSEISNIEGLLMENDYNMLRNFSEINLYSIEKKLIEGTTDEYSNRLIFSKKLEIEQAESVIRKILNDASYNWKKYHDKVPFIPNRQFVIKASTSQLSVLLDSKNNVLGFINLEGQSLVPVQDSFAEYLSKL